MISTITLLAAQALAVTAATIPWQPAAADGTRFALLEGRRDVPGEFSYAFALPPGTWDRPHRHSTTARIFVLKGSLRLGRGATMTAADKARATLYPAGSFVVVPAGMLHFDGADVETVIIGVASGPWATVYPDGGQGSAGTPK